MTHVADIWRHPIKSHGREPLKSVTLSKGKTMPFDRVWAIAHEAAKLDHDNPVWAQCANFSRGSKAQSLMAIEASFDESTHQITLTHPKRPSITINPDLGEDAERLIAWVLPLCPQNRALPTRIFKVPGRGMTDSDFPSVSINSWSSLRDFSEKAGVEISPLRFRGNIWLEDLPAWVELESVGKEIQIGGARLKIVERTERCKATTANPETGKSDLDTLKILKDNWGHLDFGVRAEVIESGQVSVGDQVSF